MKENRIRMDIKGLLQGNFEKKTFNGSVFLKVAVTVIGGQKSQYHLDLQLIAANSSRFEKITKNIQIGSPRNIFLLWSTIC